MNKRLDREQQRTESIRGTAGKLSRENLRLHREVRILGDSEARARSLSDEVFWLRHALEVSKAGKEKLKARLAKLRAAGATLSKLPSDEAAQLRAALRRSRRQKTTINVLRKNNARLRRTVRKLEVRKAALEVLPAKLRAIRKALEAELTGLRAVRKTLSKSLSVADADLRRALGRSRRQKATIKSLSRENARLRKDMMARVAMLGHAQGRPDRPAGAAGTAEPARADRLRAGHRSAAVPGPDDPRQGPSARPAPRRARHPGEQALERVRRPLPLSRIQDPGRRPDALRRPRPRRLAARHARLLHRRVEARPARQLHRMDTATAREEPYPSWSTTRDP